jgi:chromosome segregation ATPase
MKDHGCGAPLIALCMLSCASSQGEQVRDARLERIDARTEAKQGNIEERAESRSDQIAQTFDAAGEQVEASDQPGEDANETLVELAEERAQFGSAATARVNKLAARINAAREKLEVLGPRAPTALKTELQTAAGQYELLKHDVLNLESIPPARWQETKQGIDHRADLLDARVSELNEAIGDV